MPMTEKQKEWQRKKRKEGKEKPIVVQLKTEVAENWKAYAQSKGKPLATLIRELMSASMQADGWKEVKTVDGRHAKRRVTVEMIKDE